METHSIVRTLRRRYSSRWVAAMLGSAALTAHASPVRAQLTLAGALRQADSAAFGNRTARAMTELSTAAGLTPLRGILPAVRLESVPC